MSRVQFVETVTAPGGVNGALIPFAGVGATPYVVDVNGVEGGQANAYAGRIGATAASSMVTDASGTVSYWLDAGDYNIHFQDQQTPPRIADYIRGFTAPVINTDQLVIGAQNLIQFTGDLKFSMVNADHGGPQPSGAWEWLLIQPDSDGGGRQIDGGIYNVLRAAMGNPSLTSGKFRLPNISGRALIAAGAAATGGGITTSARHLLDMFGTEGEILDLTEIPAHNHGGTTVPNSTAPGSATGASGSNHTHNGPGGHPFMYSSNDQGVGAIVVSTSAASGPFATGTASGNFGVPTNNNNPWGVGLTTTTGSADHTHPIPSIAIPGLAIPTVGGGLPHNNVGPSTGMNLFVKT